MFWHGFPHTYTTQGDAMSTPQHPQPPGPPAGPPQPPGGWQGPGWTGPPPQPRKSSTGKIIGFGCLGVVVLVIVVAVLATVASSGGGSSDPKPGASKASTDRGGKSGGEGRQAGPTGDVRIDSCEVDDVMHWPSAKLTITNRSSKTSNYAVQVEFVDAGGTRIGEGFAATNNLGPGKVAKETAQGTGDVKGKVTCRVTEVTRYAS